MPLPEDYERTKMAELERDYQLLCSEIQRFQAGPQSIAEIDWFLERLREWRQYLSGYTAPCVSARLAEILHQLDATMAYCLEQQREVRRIFAEMARESKERADARDAVWRATQAKVADTLRAAAEQSRSDHDAMNRLWWQGWRASAPSASSSISSASSAASSQGWVPPDVPYSNFPSRHCAYCKVWECGKQCLQPAGHGGPCYCENNHSGYW